MDIFLSLLLEPCNLSSELRVLSVQETLVIMKALAAIDTNSVICTDYSVKLYKKGVTIIVCCIAELNGTSS